MRGIVNGLCAASGLQDGPVARLARAAFAEHDVEAAGYDNDGADCGGLIRSFAKKQESEGGGPQDLRILHRGDNRGFAQLVGADHEAQ